MVIQVSEALDSDNAVMLTVDRQAAGSFVDGVWVRGVVTVFKSLISVQQPNAKELQLLSEGERQKDIRKFISIKSLKMANVEQQTQADLINYKGAQYKIIRVNDYDDYGYTRALGARI